MSEAVNKKLVLAILGPTASGKTSVALKIAKESNGVIINCDSRQIYQGMLIGTASPTEKEKNIVEHRLFNFLSPEMQFNAADYAKLAADEIKKVWSESKLPILVGGTGFYYSAVSEGLGEAGSDSELANQLQKELEEQGLSYMAEKLKKLDSEAFETVDINNPRRVLRAIEVVTTTKKPFSQNKPVSLLPEAEFKPYVVTRPREKLHERIAIIVEQMFEEGLENEVKYIIEKYGRDAAALSSIGYREWLEQDSDLESIKEQIIIHTRQYAKRQETWFRKKPGVPFIDLEKTNDISDKILISF
ncbi:MAG: tRNA (adenosine(37)-N6)-dimethylallyltransferase MiaA [Candidatus Riflebacteria bacterium]|nr:tRNA (adenosine(37)-N6)-dimethylallyltransferase MiaA [Candidatus Riflebacteria bacterium]